MKNLFILLFLMLFYGIAGAAAILNDPNFTGEIIPEDGSFRFVDTADGSIEIFNSTTKTSYIYDNKGKIVKTDYFDISGWEQLRDTDGAFYIVNNFSLEITKYVNNVPIWKKSLGTEQTRMVSDTKWDKNKEYMYIAYNLLDNADNLTLFLGRISKDGVWEDIPLDTQLTRNRSGDPAISSVLSSECELYAFQKTTDKQAALRKFTKNGTTALQKTIQISSSVSYFRILTFLVWDDCIIVQADMTNMGFDNITIQLDKNGNEIMRMNTPQMPGDWATPYLPYDTLADNIIFVYSDPDIPIYEAYSSVFLSIYNKAGTEINSFTLPGNGNTFGYSYKRAADSVYCGISRESDNNVEFYAYPYTIDLNNSILNLYFADESGKIATLKEETSECSFKIKYRNFKNRAPSNGFPRIYLYENGIEVAGPLIMTTSDTVKDYSKGVIYTYDLSYDFQENKRYTYKLVVYDNTLTFESDILSLHKTEELIAPVRISPGIEVNTIGGTNVRIEWFSPNSDITYSLKMAGPYDTTTDNHTWMEVYNGKEKSHHITSFLETGKYYYWKVLSTNIYEESIESEVFYFSTTKIGNKAFNAPNPFNPARGQETKFVFNMPESGTAKITIYSEYGDKVWESDTYNFTGSAMEAKEITYNGKDNSGRTLYNGTYLAVITKKYGGKTKTEKCRILVVK